MKIVGIYAIRNIANGKLYIGSSNDMQKRWKEHRNGLCRNDHRNDYLQKAWNKYGKQLFEFYILEKCDESKLLEREDFFIARHKTLDGNYGYNLVGAERHIVSQRARTNIRKSAQSRRKPSSFSAEHRKKIGDALRGKRLSTETKQKMRNAALGRIMSEESRKRMSKSHKGIPLSKKHRKHISESHIGKLLGEQHREHTRAAIQQWWYDRGGHHSKEELGKMSKTRKGKPWTLARRMAEANKGKIEAIA